MNAYQPGTIPLRPLLLGDMFNAAFTTMRRNPRATVGMAALVTTGFLIVPSVIALVLAVTGWLPPMAPELTSTGTTTDSELSSFVPTFASLVTLPFSWMAGVIITGLVVRVVTSAAIGARLSPSEAWRSTRGRILPLAGLTLLNGLVILAVIVLPTVVLAGLGLVAGTPWAIGFGLLGLLIGMAAALAVHVRWFAFAPCSLVVEGAGVGRSVTRTFTLTRQMFWRTLGIYLLTSLTVGLVGQIIALPFAVVGVVFGFVMGESSYGTLALLLSSNLSTILVGALTAPFSGGVLSLQYLDARIRKEGYDVELIMQAERTTDPAPAPTGGR